MYDDLRRLPAGDQVETDLCIIGGGVAGITLARALSDTSARICLVESGAFDQDDACQRLYDGESEGFYYPPLDSGRLRYFGGSSNHWTGYCSPMTELDLQGRHWIPFTGWPLTFEDLRPYYETAQGVCQLARFAYEPGAWPTTPRFPELLPGKLVARLWQLSPPTRFGHAYREDLRRAGNLRVLLNANASELLTDDEGRVVTAAMLQTLDGKATRIRAKSFVLACGGIENARLLLLSDRNRPRGLGNDTDILGRFFMDHLEVVTATGFLTLDHPPPFAGFAADGVAMLPCLALSGRAQEAAGTLTCAISIEPPHDGRPNGYLALRRTVLSLLRGRMPDSWDKDMLAVLMDLDGVASGVTHRILGGARHMPPTRPGMPLVARTRCEQAPDPENRVLLTPERDALGLRKIKLRWRIGAMERHTLRHAVRLVGEELGRLRIARLKMVDWLIEDNEWPRLMNQGFHHIGTTRMCADPRHGVVDRDCRVHGVSNLYVAGSSVFPTSSYAPPTLTVVALALRLAEHLRTRLG